MIIKECPETKPGLYADWRQHFSLSSHKIWIFFLTLPVYSSLFAMQSTFDIQQLTKKELRGASALDMNLLLRKPNLQKKSCRLPPFQTVVACQFQWFSVRRL